MININCSVTNTFDDHGGTTDEQTIVTRTSFQSSTSDEQTIVTQASFQGGTTEKH